jgi:hypothetical protein
MIKKEAIELPRAVGEVAPIGGSRAILMKADLIEDISGATAITHAEANKILDVILVAWYARCSVTMGRTSRFRQLPKLAKGRLVQDAIQNWRGGESSRKRIAFFKLSKELKELIQRV